MRKIINSTYITLDGVIEGPHLWPSLGPRDECWEQIQSDLLLSGDALLISRRTYEGFAPVWPTRLGDPYSDHINSMPKYVVSSTLSDPEWHNTQVVDGDVVAAITRLKESPAPSVAFRLVGSRTLSHGIIILNYVSDNILP